MSDADLLALNGGKIPTTTFRAAYETNLMSLVDFIQEGMRDTAQYIAPIKPSMAATPPWQALRSCLCQCPARTAGAQLWRREQAEYVGTSLDNPGNSGTRSFGSRHMIPSALRTNWPLRISSMCCTPKPAWRVIFSAVTCKVPVECCNARRLFRPSGHNRNKEIRLNVRVKRAVN
jgi:hypothetical protein